VDFFISQLCCEIKKSGPATLIARPFSRKLQIFCYSFDH
jgi:hypothetical protein